MHSLNDTFIVPVLCLALIAVTVGVIRYVFSNR